MLARDPTVVLLGNKRGVEAFPQPLKHLRVAGRMGWQLPRQLIEGEAPLGLPPSRLLKVFVHKDGVNLTDCALFEKERFVRGDGDAWKVFKLFLVSTPSVEGADGRLAALHFLFAAACRDGQA